MCPGQASVLSGCLNGSSGFNCLAKGLDRYSRCRCDVRIVAVACRVWHPRGLDGCVLSVLDHRPISVILPVS